MCHLEAILHQRQAYISQQLIVREAGLIDMRREGWNVYYRLADARVLPVLVAARTAVGATPPDGPGVAPNCSCPKCTTEPAAWEAGPPARQAAKRYAARARLTNDISAALPYLNATLRGAVYNRAANALTWKKVGHNIAFHAYEIATSNVEDRDGAIKEPDGLIAMVNRTWDRRASIVPDDAMRRRPAPMALHRLLPQTNCKQCGAVTRMALAFGLAQDQRRPSECPPLQHGAAFAECRPTLEAML